MKIVGAPVLPHDKMNLVSKTFLKETRLTEDFMDVKDFFYNIGKSFCVSTVMDSKDYRLQLFNIFNSFVDHEYTTLYLSRHG